MPKTSPKAPTTRPTEGISAASPPGAAPRHAGHHDLGDSAGDDQVEQIEIGRTLSAKPWRVTHCFTWIPMLAIQARGPHAGVPGSGRPRCRARRAPGSGHPPGSGDTSGGPAGVAGGREWDSLPAAPARGGDITPALDLEHLDAAPLQRAAGASGRLEARVPRPSVRRADAPPAAARPR